VLVRDHIKHNGSLSVSTTGKQGWKTAGIFGFRLIGIVKALLSVLFFIYQPYSLHWQMAFFP
jgi:hypothetical protein